MKKLSTLYIILSGILWGIIGVFSRILGTVGWNALQITEARCVVAGVLLVLFLFVTDRQKLKIRLKDGWMFLGTGICSLVFFNICSFYTIAHTTMAVAAMLLYTAPCMVMVMSAVFFKERLTVTKVISLLVAIFGCVLVTDLSGADKLSPFLVLSGLGAAFGYALYSIFSVPALKKYSPLTVTVYTFIVAGIFLIPFSKPWSMVGAVTSAHGLWGMLGLGILSTLLPYILYTKGLQYTEAGKASVMAFSEPLTAALAGILVFGESLTVKNALGIFCMFVSILLISARSPKKK